VRLARGAVGKSLARAAAGKPTVAARAAAAARSAAFYFFGQLFVLVHLLYVLGAMNAVVGVVDHTVVHVKKNAADFGSDFCAHVVFLVSYRGSELVGKANKKAVFLGVNLVVLLGLN